MDSWAMEMNEQRRRQDAYKARRDELAEHTAQELFLWESKTAKKQAAYKPMSFDAVLKQFGVQVAMHLQMFREGSRTARGLVFFADKLDDYELFRRECLAEVVRLLMLDSHEWEGKNQAESSVTLGTIREDFGCVAAGMWYCRRNGADASLASGATPVGRFFEELEASTANKNGKNKNKKNNQNGNNQGNNNGNAGNAGHAGKKKNSNNNNSQVNSNGNNGNAGKKKNSNNNNSQVNSNGNNGNAGKKNKRGLQTARTTPAKPATSQMQHNKKRAEKWREEQLQKAVDRVQQAVSGTGMAPGLPPAQGPSAAASQAVGRVPQAPGGIRGQEGQQARPGVDLLYVLQQMEKTSMAGKG